MGGSEPAYISPQEAAGMLNISARSLYSWLRSGELPGVKVGRVWRVDKRVVLEHPRIKYGLGRYNGK